MAEDEKSGSGKLEAVDGKGNKEVKENGVAKSPVKQDVNGSEEPSGSPKTVKETSSVQKAEINGAAKSPGAHVNGVGAKPTESPEKETSKEQNGEKTTAEPENGEKAEDEEPEGSKSLDT